MAIISLTQSIIPTLTCPEGKRRIEYCDRDLPGLLLEVRASGSASWLLRYKAGTTKYVNLGPLSEVTLHQARALAKDLKAKVRANGFDPRAEINARKAVLTYAEFFEQHVLGFIKSRKRSWRSDESLYRNYLQPVFGKTRISQISRQQIQSMHTALRESGKAAATANHAVKQIRSCLNLAVDWGMLESNPASRVPLLFEDNKRERYMDNTELVRLLHVLQTDSNRPVCLILQFLLSTGARLNEALSAQWDQVNRENRVWRIPASNSKSKRVRSVPLNDAAIDILNQLDTEGKFSHLFINKQSGQRYTTITKVWDRLRREANLGDVLIHSLRHQYASLLVNSGRTIFEVQQILGHANPITTQRYAHLSTKTLQDAANSASVIIKGAMQQEVKEAI